MLKLSQIDVGSVVMFKSGVIGRIVTPSESLPYYMRMAIVSGPTGARTPLPVYLKSIVSVKCMKSGNWMLVSS